MDQKNLVFASVFPVPSLSHTTPTPIATPDLGFTAPGSSFGSPFINNATTGEQRAVRRNLAWSTATRFLSLPKPPNDSSYASFYAQKPARGPDVEEALQYLLAGEGRSEGDGKEEALMDWYTNETRIHFANYVRPALAELWKSQIELRNSWDVLAQTQEMLEQVQNLYIRPFNDHILPFLQPSNTSGSTIRPARRTDMEEPAEADTISARYRRDIHAVFAHCLPQQRLSKTLSYILYDAGCRIFSIYIRHDGLQPSAAPENISDCRKRLVSLLVGLEGVGLGGDNAQKAFAHAMDKLLDSFIASHYTKVDWYSKKSIVSHLRMYIKNGFTPFVELVMECLKSDSSTVQPTELQVWQDMALGRLGRARVENMFDFVINWDKSLGAILDIKEYLKVPGAKQHLTSSFSQQVSRRLLHPGATTTYILNVYISMIRTFHELEPKGVLLERVARPVRRYLKERDDTARIIISSLLTDINDETGSKFASGGELSYEIASEMQKPFAANFNQEADEELNWNDMNWQPLPTDASPEYKKSKVEDVIWFLLTLWEREDFINELKNILGDHLLRCQDPEYEKEIRLLELIKVRLGDDKLQACEVMLRDVLESKRINATVRTGGGFGSASKQLSLPQTPDNAPGPRTPRPRRGTAATPSLLPSTPSLKPPSGPALNAQILSSFFWPLLRDDHFLVPSQIQTLQKEYEARFERIKGMRKLRWMNALGDGTVTLDFEDRTEEFEHLMPWQVSVIYAFQCQSGEEWAVEKGKGKGKDGGIARNVEQLEEMLEMDEQLVRQALAFWVGQSVLRETQTDTFEVIEKRTAANTDTDAAAAAQELAQVQAEAQVGAVRSQADLLMEKKEVYESFIHGMLTAQGNLNVQRILMMMRMMVQGGFPFGADEVKMLLTEMEGEEKVVNMGGDMWGIRR
jgi:anaphase-promoting complex subunit 2